jgi:hypothetical protein
MYLFDSFVTCDECLRDVEALAGEPSVRHVIRMPRGWLVYEFHHDLFGDPEFLTEGAWREKMARRPELRHARIAMLAAQRDLLAPWHAKKTPGAVGVLATPVCTYHIASPRRLRRIDFVPVDDWGIASEFSFRLEAESINRPVIALRLLEEWLACGESSGELRLVGSIETGAGVVSAQARCASYSGHWLAALWALLCDPRLKADAGRLRVISVESGPQAASS